MSTELVIKELSIADDHRYSAMVAMALKEKGISMWILWKLKTSRTKCSLEADVLRWISVCTSGRCERYRHIAEGTQRCKDRTDYVMTEMIAKWWKWALTPTLLKQVILKEIYQAILTCMNDDFYFNDLVNKAVLLSKLQTKNKFASFIPIPSNFLKKKYVY